MRNSFLAVGFGVFVMACGGSSKPAPAPPTTGGAVTEPSATEKTCHDTTNCEGYGSCIALCEGSSAGDAAKNAECTAQCEASCPQIACPAP